MNILFLFLKFLYGFLGVTCFNFQIGHQGNKRTNLDRFDGSCGQRNLPMIAACNGIRTEGEKIIAKLTMTAKEDLPSDLMVLLSFERCKSKENLDTCQHFHDYQIDNYCETLDSNLIMWSAFYRPFQPKYTCPIKKGVYRSNGSTVNPTMFLTFVFQDAWYWKIKIEVRQKHTNKLIMCVRVEARIAVSPN